MEIWEGTRRLILRSWRLLVKTKDIQQNHASEEQNITDEQTNEPTADSLEQWTGDIDVTLEQDGAGNLPLRNIPFRRNKSTKRHNARGEVREESQTAFPLLDDQPSITDSLDFASYVQALKDIIAHDETRTPLTLGIFGRWGMGKTTLMKMIEKELNKDGITTIWFNAWQYSNEDELWAAFLQSVLNKIQNSLGSLKLPVFKIRLLIRRMKWKDIPGFFIQFLLRVVITILPVLIIDPVSQQLTPLAKSTINLGSNIISIVLAYLVLLKPVFDSIRKNTTINMGDFQQTSNYQEHIAFLDKFRDHFSDIVQSLPDRRGKRLAIFIDDLDRCSSERTLQVLDAIKLFIDANGCIFILGVDVEVVQKAVAYKYKDDITAQREYIGKIIQLPFQLPPLTRSEMQKFLRQLMLNLPDPHCQDVFVTGLGVNPREMKRTINIFSLLWNLASKRSELKGRINPVRLAKVVVIQQGYPEIHKILQQRPYLLKDIENYYRKQVADASIRTDNPSEKQSQESSVLDIVDLPENVIELLKNESLRSMLLLHDVMELIDFGNYNFSRLQPDEIAIYFTLTSRAEAPIPNDNDEDGKSSVVGTERTQGYVVAGRYIINFELGRGGMSAVYSAFDRRVEKAVALKYVYATDISRERREKMENRFKMEMQILAKLNHPNIVPIYDYGVDKGSLYYVMEHLSGGSLRARGKLSLEMAIKILYPLLDALQNLHERNIIHRDIKPENILFDEREKPYLVDFGLIKIIDPEQGPGLTGTGKIVGTPAYMSPEQIRGREIDGRADIYSMGVVFFEIITGKRPYNANTPIELSMQHLHDPIPKAKQYLKDLPVEVDQVITKCMAKDAEDRYQTALDVKKALIEIFPDLDTLSKQTQKNVVNNPTPTPPGRILRRK